MFKSHLLYSVDWEAEECTSLSTHRARASRSQSFGVTVINSEVLNASIKGLGGRVQIWLYRWGRSGRHALSIRSPVQAKSPAHLKEEITGVGSLLKGAREKS